MVLSLGRELLRGITHLLYPNTCWTCGTLMPIDDGPVCATCLPGLTHDPFPTCPRCSSTVGPHLVLENCPECRNEIFAFDGARRMGPYAGLLREVILRMKHWTGEDLAEVVAGVWAKRMLAHVAPLSPDLVVPVPLHWWRRWRRGFNACDILATALARELKIPCNLRLLKWARATAQQRDQASAAARKANVKHAFNTTSDMDLRGKTILLIDDVLTTGATAHEAARALKLLKPKALYVIVMAHGH